MYKNTVITILALILAACGKPQPAAEAPKAPKPLVSGIEVANFDKSVRPQDDFYRYVNGTWLKTAKIPADRGEYGAFVKLDEDSQTRLRTIIEESSAKPQKASGSDEQKVGDLYASFMNEKKLDDLGLKPLEGEIARIDAVQNNDQLASLFAHLGLINVNIPIGDYVNQDDKEPTQYIVNFFQSGLGLPDRDFYLVDDPKFKEIRQKYLTHIEKMLTLAGDKSAAAEAKQIMDLETAL